MLIGQKLSRTFHLLLIALLTLHGVADAGYHQVDPEVSEWREDFCSTGNTYVGTYCEAKGG